ncbi:MAG: bifunctional 5,10-methylenetetrahydrofolate dehydrogenase/5,10-methenyltetrahydrofolate cyclohydrolase, partial [Patescibacteria group bacterium]
VFGRALFYVNLISMILDGKKLNGEIAEGLKKKIEESGVVPTLAIIQVGNVEESNAYIRGKKAYGERIGAKVLHIVMPVDVTEADLLNKIDELNHDDNVNGIIVQQPISKHLNKHKIVESVNPNKDVDGLHSINAGKVFIDDLSGILPATAKGVVTLLKYYGIEIEGKKVLVIGKSMLVGKPVAMLLLREGATITIAHSKTKDLKAAVKESDIVVVAVGKIGLITRDMVREGQVIVDVGINSIIDSSQALEESPTRKLIGDVAFDEVKDIVYAISPVPGGAGPMTIASLFENLVEVSLRK